MRTNNNNTDAAYDRNIQCKQSCGLKKLSDWVRATRDPIKHSSAAHKCNLPAEPKRVSQLIGTEAPRNPLRMTMHNYQKTLALSPTISFLSERFSVLFVSYRTINAFFT